MAFLGTDDSFAGRETAAGWDTADTVAGRDTFAGWCTVAGGDTVAGAGHRRRGGQSICDDLSSRLWLKMARICSGPSGICCGPSESASLPAASGSRDIKKLELEGAMRPPGKDASREQPRSGKLLWAANEAEGTSSTGPEARMLRFVRTCMLPGSRSRTTTEHHATEHHGHVLFSLR